MMHLTRPSPLCLMAAAALLLCTSLAQAQYVWIDANGTRHYSDRPPPPSTPRSKILKAPQLSPYAQEPDAPAAAPEKKKTAPTLAQREKDFEQRQQAQADAQRKAAAEAQRQQAQRENCDTARQYKAELESGIRVAATNADGERSFLSDEDRAARLAQTNRILQGCR
jgi:type IV secretory pathway VirB10-like protein